MNMVILELDLGFRTKYTERDIYIRNYASKSDALKVFSSLNSFKREFDEELEGGFNLFESSACIYSESGKCLKKFDNLAFLGKIRYPE